MKNLKLLMLFLLISSCKCKEESTPFQIKDLLTIEGSLISGQVFLSDKEGKNLTCESIGTLSDFGSLVLQNKIPMDDDYFDLSFVTSSNSNQNVISIETHTNVQNSEWYFKPLFGTVAPNLEQVTFLADDMVNEIEYLIIQGGTTSLTSNQKLVETGMMDIQINPNNRNVFLRIKMTGETERRYVEFNDLMEGDTIQLDIANYPIGQLTELQTDDADLIRVKQLTGLNESGSFLNSKGIYSSNSFIQDYLLPVGKVVYHNNIFEEFFIELEMEKDSFHYLMENMGDAVLEYYPTSPQVTIDGNEVESFRVSTTDPSSDFLSVTWSIVNSQGRIEWTVFHSSDETDFFVLPELPSCILFDQSWFSRDDFEVKSIQSYHYENFTNYQDYINTRYTKFDPLFIGDDQTKLILLGGDFEKKSVLK